MIYDLKDLVNYAIVFIIAHTRGNQMTEKKTQQQKLKEELDFIDKNYSWECKDADDCEKTPKQKEEIKMNEEKKDDNAIEDFLKGPQAEFEQPFEGMFNQLHLTINALNNKLKSMQLEIDKFKAPKVSVDDSNSDNEPENNPHRCCEIS